MDALFSINEKEVAAKLAHESAEVQAAFLEVFSQELKAVCQTRFKAETQLAFINHTLREETREFLAGLTYRGEGK